MWLRRAQTVAAPGVFVWLVGVLLAAGAAQSDRSWPVRLGALALAIAAGGAALLRRRRSPDVRRRASPWRALASALTGGAAVVVLCSGDSANLGWFAIVVVAGWTATVDLRRCGVPFTAAAIAQYVVQWTVVQHDSGWSAWIAGTLFGAVTCAMGRRQSELIDQLRAAQAELAERARSEERQRISRELHDVIGHAITVSLLHVSSARLALEEDPAEAASALLEAERVTREGLTEIRQAVGLLQDVRSAPGGRDAVRPLPTVVDVAQLVERVRRAGTPVELSVSGDVAGVPATVGLTVHRIVQEALTNAMRHGAPGGAADVRIAVERRAVTVTIDSEGRPVDPQPGGTGVAGMLERAAAVGGTCAAGPHGDGWRVHAVLPLAVDIGAAQPVAAR